MDYSLSFAGVNHERAKDIQERLENLLEYHYSIMGSHDLLVEESSSCVVVYPKTGKIDTVIPIIHSSKTAEFRSSDSSGVRFVFDGTSYVVRYNKKID